MPNALEANTIEPINPFYRSCAHLLDFEWHSIAQKFLYSDAQIRVIIKGNQGGGTAVTTMDAILRLLAMHPVERRNRIERPIRFVSKCLPKNDEDEENQQYVEFKRRFPPEFIKSDVTSRSHNLTIRDPLGGSDKKVEFLSKKMEIDAFMSVQRSAYYQDEEIERLKWDENLMRLATSMKEGAGDVVLTLTPVRGLDWTYDSIWKRAKRIYRSEKICEKYGFPPIEDLESNQDIEIFCWATDDNPIMDPQSLNRLFLRWEDDEDELAMRRYGVFRQVSGRIFKTFDSKIHVVPFDKVWDESLFRRYWHYRMIDYHPSKPWYVSWVAISPTHEWFVWNELKAFHHHDTDIDIRDRIKVESLLEEDEEYNRATLIDPLAKIKQQNTGFSVFDDISMGEQGLRRCRSADTKHKADQISDTGGRMNVMLRLKNSVICGVPGNNLNKDEPEDIRYGKYRPTIWFMDNCSGHVEHFRSWRYIDFKQEAVKAVRETKRESEKWSDYCRNIEFLGSLNPVWYDMPKSEHKPSKLFQGRRARG